MNPITFRESARLAVLVPSELGPEQAVAAHHTAEAHAIAVLTVVLNNAGYGAVADSVTGMHPTGYAAKADQVPLTGLSPTRTSASSPNRAARTPRR